MVNGVQAMASPQKENGYTPIANELLEKIYSLKTNATGLKILLVICRYTYGFSRKSHSLSVSFITKATGISSRQIKKELSNLIESKIVNVVTDSTYSQSRILALNKDYDVWGNKATVPQVNDNSTGEQQFPTTEEQQLPQDKQNIKQDVQMCFEKLWGLYPNKRGRAKVSAKCKSEIAKLGYDVMAECIRRYIADKPDWQQYQNGSTFFNSGYLDYLDSNYKQATTQEYKPIIPH